MDRPDQFIPHLIVRDGLAALEFYKETFAADEGDRMMSPDGKKLLHGEIVLNGQKLFVSDWFAPDEGGSLSSPDLLGGTCTRVTIMAADADEVVRRAVKLGAKVIMPVQDMFWGARYGKIVDPFGHEWGINQQLEEITPEETQNRADEFFASQK